MRKRSSSSRPAFVLIMVMVVLTGLSLLALHLAARCRMRLSELTTTTRAAQARWLAYASVQRGLDALANTDPTRGTGLNSSWALLGHTTDANLFTHEIDGLAKDLAPCCAVQDEHAKINVTSADHIARVAQLGDWGKWLAPVLADWTDPDDDRRIDGAESGDYQDSPEYGYTAKNRPLQIVEELRLLKGVSPQVYLGEDTNGNGLLDSWEDDGLAHLPADNQDGKLDLGPWSLLTCAGNGKINVNTAPQEVLATLPGFDRSKAAAVVALRQSAASGVSQQPPFTSFDGFCQALGLDSQAYAYLQGLVCTSSSDFRIVATVRDARGRLLARQEVLVERDAQGGCQVRMYSGW